MRTPTFNRRTALIAGAAAFVASFGIDAAAEASSWPNGKPITWLVGFAPGGTLDVLTRIAARKLSEKTGQSVVVDNRPGASGAIALQAAAKATPDGYTLVTVPGPIMFKSPPPELGNQLTVVAMLAQGPMVLVGGAANGPSSVQDLIKAIKSDPKAWSFASSGNGTSQHLAGELFNVEAGTNMMHIPYKGGGQAVIDVVGGQVPLAMLGVTPVLPHIKSGKLKAYAVTTNYRIESLPGVPTMEEAGLKGYDAAQWYAVGAPKGTPPEVIAKLNGWLNEIGLSPEMKAALVSSGSVAGTGSPREVQDFVDADLRRWKDLAKKSNLDLD
jgi:tripartite-type tricarboxylate transporter receptor subunit TctC